MPHNGYRHISNQKIPKTISLKLKLNLLKKILNRTLKTFYKCHKSNVGYKKILNGILKVKPFRSPIKKKYC